VLARVLGRRGDGRRPERGGGARRVVERQDGEDEEAAAHCFPLPFERLCLPGEVAMRVQRARAAFQVDAAAR
jgi:hypothetical protein